MSQENVEAVERILAEWAAGDFGAAIGDFDPHIVLVVRPSFPEHGVFLGPDGIRDYMGGFLAQWERYAIEGKNVQVVGDTVLADVIQRGTGKVSGVETETPSFVLFTFRAAKIVRMEFVLDEREALEAVGFSE
jgi:ketosteroid isomerase-like protein